MIRRVSRNGKHFTAKEYAEIARLLVQMYEARRALAHMMNGRVLVKWLDPLFNCGGKRALSFFDKLRSALDDDYLEAVDGRPHESPFCGDKFSVGPLGRE